MNGINNEYIAMKLHQARQYDLERESAKDRLAQIALKKVRLPMRLPKIKIGKN